MSETVSASVPINIRWTQELVDDGKGGSNFYMRLTPKIATGGRYAKGTSRNAIVGVVDSSGTVVVKGLLTVIQHLKREKSNEIQKAAKYGMQQGINAAEYNKNKQKQIIADAQRVDAKRRESEQINDQMPVYNPYSSRKLEEMVQADIASGKIDSKSIQFETDEKEEKKEVEEIIYIK